MEPETGAAAKGKDSNDDRNAPDPSSLTGKKADQDQQILMDTGDTNWYKNTQALKYLQPVFMPIVKDTMKSLQLQSMTDFGRQLCAEATTDDIILVNGRLAQFKHLCPGTVVACQTLLNIIKGHTSDSVNFYQMLKGTDPQNWLKSPFDFVRLFLKDWMRSDIHDFQECDITALCTIVKRCKPLMQIFDERKIDELRKVRNRTMHPATMRISQQEMENNIDVIIDFLEHIKSLKSTDEVTEAIESIKQLRTGDVRLLHSMVVRLIQGWIPGAILAYEHTCDQANNQLQDIDYIQNLLARLSSGQEITPIKQSAEHEFGAKIEKLTDESQKLKQTTEELAKEKEQKRKLEKQIEELRKLRQEEKRESEEQIKKLNERLQEEKRESEEQIKKLKERLETNERRSFGEACRPKEISTQRSTDDAHEVEKPPKRTASGGQRFPMKALSASTGPGDKGKTVQKDFHAISWLFDSAARTRSGDEHGTVKEDFSKPEPPYDSPRMALSSLKRLDLELSRATGCIDVSTIPVKSDKDRRPCNITGMVAISGTQLMLADGSNECIKLLDLETGTVIREKVLPSAPHDVTCVPGSRIAVTIPILHQIHVFTADQSLEQRDIMEVDGMCLEIHYSGDKFFVSCRGDPPLVHILNLGGNIIKTIQLFSIKIPMDLTCSPDIKFIYVSELYKDTVTCMDMAGCVQWRYKCRHPKSGQTLPQGVCTGDGCIYICIFDEIHVVSPTGTKLEVIPFNRERAVNTAVCYSSQERTLYVSRFPHIAENTYISIIRMH